MAKRHGLSRSPIRNRVEKDEGAFRGYVVTANLVEFWRHELAAMELLAGSRRSSSSTPASASAGPTACPRRMGADGYHALGLLCRSARRHHAPRCDPCHRDRFDAFCGQPQAHLAADARAGVARSSSTSRKTPCLRLQPHLEAHRVATSITQAGAHHMLWRHLGRCLPSTTSSTQDDVATPATMPRRRTLSGH